MKPLFHQLFPWVSSAALSMGILGFGDLLEAAPVDLSPPANALGSMDQHGHLRLFQDLGTVELGSMVVPLRLDFSSGRVGEASEFGWQGWSCGVLDATARPYQRLAYLEIRLLCTKVLYLSRDDAASLTYTSADGMWHGSLIEGAIRVWREDGWELQFDKTRLVELTTDQGTNFRWERDAEGRLLSIRPSEGQALLSVEWDALRQKVVALSTGSRRYAFAYTPVAEGGSLTTVSWDLEGGLPRQLAVDLAEQTLTLTPDREAPEAFRWNSSGLLLEDALGTYQYKPKDGDQAQRMMLTRRDGVVLVRESNTAAGITVRSRSDGSRVVERRLIKSGPLHEGVARIDLQVGKESHVLLRQQFGPSGLVVVREWRGDPTRYMGLAGGRIEDAFLPTSQPIYPDDTLAAVGVGEMPLRSIMFTSDAQGRHLTTSLDGVLVLRREWDRSGRLVLEEMPGRFRTETTRREDGSSETVVTPLDGSGAAERIHAAEAASARVRLAMVHDSDGRLSEERFLDGRIARHCFDSDDRLIETRSFAPDGQTLLETKTVAYDATSRRRFETFVSGDGSRTLAQEVYLSAEGRELRRIGVKTQPAWVASTPVPSRETPRVP